MQLVAQLPLARALIGPMLIAEQPARVECIAARRREPAVRHIPAQFPRKARQQRAGIADAPRKAHILGSGIHLRIEFIARTEHPPRVQPRTEVAAILMGVLGITPDIEPAREAQAVARRIAAAHDRHPLARRDRHVRREMQTA